MLILFQVEVEYITFLVAVAGSEISAVKMFFSTVFGTLDYSHNNLYKQLLLSAGMRGKHVTLA